MRTLGTHVEGFGLSVLGPDLWLTDGGQVGAAHGQQSPATAMDGGGVAEADRRVSKAEEI